ncbi:MAG: hypothetical protein ACXVXJ_10220, partial [Mycobacteriaceae bacterium]
AIVPAGSITATPVGNTLGPAYTGPTPDLAAVANNLHFRAKSVSTFISVPPGLPVSNSVTISVGYEVDRITQSYDPLRGTGLLFDYPVGDGLAHQHDIWVTLSHPNPHGGVYNLAVNWKPTVEPLYDVSFSGLLFTLLTDCSGWLGNPYLRLDYRSASNAWRTESMLQLGPYGNHYMPSFAGTLREVAHSSAYYHPSSFLFRDWDSDRVAPPLNSSKLVPGTTGNVSYTLWNYDDACWGKVQYSQTITLDTYNANFFGSF